MLKSLIQVKIIKNLSKTASTFSFEVKGYADLYHSHEIN